MKSQPRNGHMEKWLFLILLYTKFSRLNAKSCPLRSLPCVINDINNTISLSYFHLYADDTIIIRASNCTVDFLSSMEAELASLDDWFVLDKLTPNKKKCENIFFANQVNIKKCSGLTIKFCGIELETKIIS